MEALPLEIVHLVLSFLPTNDLSNWRLSSKECAKAGERHLVQDLHVMYNAKSFFNLLHISRHPSLSKYVRSIFYEVRYMEEVDQTEFEENILEDHPQYDCQDAKAIIFNAWTAYKRKLDEQRYIKKTSYDVSVFTQAFARFPLLKRIEVSSEYNEPSEILKRAYEGTMAVSGLMLDGGEMNEDDETGTRALMTVLLAAAGMEPGLEYLNAHRIHWSFFSAKPLPLHIPAYRNLRHLDLEFEADFGDFDEQEIVEARHVELGKVIRSATGLETLRLVFDEPDMNPKAVHNQHLLNVPVVWERITGDTTWPKLRSLELQVATCSETEIMRFFTRHAGTLKSIKLVNMWLTNCTNGWLNVFKVMKNSLKLGEVDLGGFWGQDGPDGLCKLVKVQGQVGTRISKVVMGLGDMPKTLELSSEDAAELGSPFFQFLDYYQTVGT